MSLLRGPSKFCKIRIGILKFRVRRFKPDPRLMNRISVYILLLLLIAAVSMIMFIRSRHKPEEEIWNGEPLRSGIMIKVFNMYNDKIQEMDLEEYLLGVVAAEMPAYFEMEALKAQAVAARTYAYGRITGEYGSGNRHTEADICTDPAHCQAWIDKASIFRRWGIVFSYANWDRICKAVRDTKNMVIIYNGKIANPLYHSNGGGRTENAEDVWDGTVVDYLKSVVSYGDEYSPEYKSKEKISFKEFADKIKKRYPQFDSKNFDPLNDVGILSLTEGGSINEIKVGNLVLKGTELREIFAMKSAKCTFEPDGSGHFVFTVCGYGHGVGMSQWGADYFAKCGAVYDEIIKYYYQGVSIVPIK